MKQNIMDFNKSANSLVIYLRNVENASQEIISRPFINDIMMTVNLIISENQEETVSIQVTKIFSEYWGVSEDKIFEIALNNTKSMIPHIEKLSDIIRSMLGDIDLPEEDGDDNLELYVMSNSSNLNGASCILQSANLKYFCKKVKTENVIIIPASIHESLLIPVRENSFIKAEDIDLIIEEVNNNMVSQDEILSYHSLMWNLKSGWL